MRSIGHMTNGQLLPGLAPSIRHRTVVRLGLAAVLAIGLFIGLHGVSALHSESADVGETQPQPTVSVGDITVTPLQRINDGSTAMNDDQTSSKASSSASSLSMTHSSIQQGSTTSQASSQVSTTTTSSGETSTSVSVNGQPVAVPDEGDVDQTITDESGTTQVHISSRHGSYKAWSHRQGNDVTVEIDGPDQADPPRDY